MGQFQKTAKILGSRLAPRFGHSFVAHNSAIFCPISKRKISYSAQDIIIKRRGVFGKTWCLKRRVLFSAGYATNICLTLNGKLVEQANIKFNKTTIP
jgi:hypothetical protein